MDIETLRTYCLSKPLVTEDFPFDEETLVFRFFDKIFAAINLGKPDRITLKCNPDYALELRERYASITGAWHWNKRYWNDVVFQDTLPDELLYSLVDHAYDEIRCKLPKKTLYYFPDFPDGWTHEHLPEVDSTLSYLRSQPLATGVSGHLVTADFQTAGYGQRGNHWESAAGQNLLFSFRTPVRGVSASHSFLLSEALALSVAQALSRYGGSDIQIKWPNDIYYGPMKIAGLLLETQICGSEVTEVLVGVGINVNQREFHSDAPNPISLYKVKGREVDRSAVLRNLLQAWVKNTSLLASGKAEFIQETYYQKLYRRQGFHPYRDAQGEFHAEIYDVRPDGQLLLRDIGQNIRSYYFKEVEYLQ